ncbi:uncharacterized protein GGS25DRAFT_505620 [Hypoxylon fragiforme]|uniref:uncharacterized protein n=1 Tax=Hypoxylon fragiforme TaxID=63214 RepID=UPI0020C611AB|nr:uncharacterized protein GGS25DRAFT_505620 [Hypoxylon fragiforme]KAI2603831.1 hypothetical protein GGS25DRAFT_505620 [Hypoxylon fragiforme]
MSSIGPQIPPHLSKRKRNSKDDSLSGSPAPKVRATDRAPANQDEISLSSDDDDYSPSAPKSTARGPIGPTMPPSNTDEVQLDDSDDDDIGPSAPPLPSTTRPTIGPTLPPTNNDEIPLGDNDSEEDDDDVGPAPAPAPSAPAKRVHGPAPPPAPLAERPPDLNSDSDDDSDDDYGPALPTSTSHLARATQAQAAAEASRAAAEAAGPRRDDWMLAPPSPGSSNRAPDPTKLKSRRFNSGPRSSASSNNPGGEISSIWTETPEQKRKRLENAVLGRSNESSTQRTTTAAGAGNSSSGAGRGDKPTPEALEQQERIRSFTEATRGKSLYEEHQSSRKGRTLREDEEEDDPSKRAFDREKDMKLGGRINATKRREFMNHASEFTGKFTKGKYL